MERQELDLRSLSQAVRRSWPTIVVAVLAGVLLALVAATVTPKKYQASSSVILRRSGDTGNTPSGDMATEVAIAHSVPVAARVQIALGIDEPVEKFLKRYTATARTDDVLLFAATAPTADDAVAVANTLAEQFLAYRREQDDERVDVLRRSLSDRISQVEADIAELDDQIAAVPEPATPGASNPTTTRLVEARQTLVQELGSLRGSIDSAVLQATIAGEGSKIVERASPPEAPTQPNLRMNLILGVLGGLAVGIGIVVVRELTSARLRTRHDIAQVAGASVLRSFRLPGRRLVPVHGSRLSRAWSRPGTSFERAVPAIVAELGLAKTTDALVVSSVDCDGEAGLVALKLAREVAEAGHRPLVADLGDGPSTLQTMLASLDLLADKGDEGEPPQRWFVPTTTGSKKGTWVGLADGAVKLASSRSSQRWTVSSKSAAASEADVLIVYSSAWASTDEPPSLTLASLGQVPGLLVVPAGRVTAETLRRYAEALVHVSSVPAGVIVVQPDRFDETTGQLDLPPSTSGPTPLRSWAAES